MTHPRGTHDDAAAAAAGALVYAKELGSKRGGVVDCRDVARAIRDFRDARRAIGKNVYGAGDHVHPHERYEPAPLMRMRSRDAWLNNN